MTNQTLGHEAPNSKHQAPNEPQITSTKSQSRFGHRDFEFGICLGFVILDFGFHWIL